MHHLLVSLRNAFDAHDRPLFEDLLKRVDDRLSAQAEASDPRPRVWCGQNGIYKRATRCTGNSATCDCTKKY